MHALPGAQAGKLRLFLVLLGAERDIRPVAAEAHRHWLAGLGIGAELARAGGLVAVNRLGLFLHQALEGAPETLHEWPPGGLAAADRVQLILELGGEVVIDVAGEMLGEEAADRAAD